MTVAMLLGTCWAGDGAVGEGGLALERILERGFDSH